MIIIIATIKYGSTYYNTFTTGVCSNYHGYFFQCKISLQNFQHIHIYSHVTDAWMQHEVSPNVENFS